MKTSLPNIQVNITVEGSVENSTITGVNFLAPSGKSRDSDSFFEKFFIEYLGIPSLLELRTRHKVSSAKRNNQVAVYSSVQELWFSHLAHFQSVHPLDGTVVKYREGKTKHAAGTVVKLSNIQLCAFINRNPGYQYAYPSSPSREVSLDSLLIGVPLIYAENYIARNGGLGDIRYPPVDGKHILNAVPSPDRMNTQFGLGNLSPDKLDAKNLKVIFNDGRMCEPWLLDSHTAYGFPIVMSGLVYEKIRPMIETFGAAAISQLTGILGVAPAESALQWYPGIPKLALFVDDRDALKGITEPKPFVGSAWTIVYRNDKVGYQLAYWPFILGIKNYLKSIKRATEIIREEIAKYNAEPLFEFDYECNWFSEKTPFTTQTITEVFKHFNGNYFAKQKYRNDLAHLFELTFEWYCWSQEKIFDHEFGPDHNLNTDLKKAVECCSMGLACLKGNEMGEATDHFLKALTHQPKFVWSHLLLAICALIKGEPEKASYHIHMAMESAVDDLCHQSDHYYYNQYANWYLLIWVIADYLNLKSPAEEAGEFNPLENSSVKEAFGLDFAQNKCHVILGELLSRKEEVLNLDQLFDCWLTECPLPSLQADMTWVVKRAFQLDLKEEGKEESIGRDLRINGINKQLARIGDNTEKVPTSEWLRKLPIILGRSNRIKTIYPLISNDSLREIANGDIDVVFDALNDSSYRARRIAEHRLLELSNKKIESRLKNGNFRLKQVYKWLRDQK